MSLKEKAVSGLFWSFSQQFSSQAIGFVVSIILSRLLSPQEFGLIAMLSIFIGLATALINSGLTQSLIRSQHLDDEDYSTVFYFNLVGSFLIYIFVYILAPYIAQFYKQDILVDVIRVYCLTFIINAFSAIQTTRLTIILDFKTQMKVSVPSLLIGSIVGISLALEGYGVWSLVWSGVSQSISNTLQLWFWSKWIPLWVFNVQKFKKHFLYGVKLMFSGMLDIIFTNSYTIIIGKFFAPAQVGFYNRADSLQMIPISNVSSLITKVSFPLFASIQNDDLRLKSVYKRIMQMVVFLVTPILLIMAVLAEPLFRFLFTERWLPAVPYFQILSFGGILYPIHSYNLQILNVKGRSDLFLKLEVIKKIMVVFIIFFSLKYGIYGLLIGGLVSSLVAFFINTHYSGKFLNYSALQQIKDLLPIIVLAFFMSIIVYFFNNWLGYIFNSDIIHLVFSGFFGGVIYFLLAYIFKMDSLFELVQIIKRK